MVRLLWILGEIVAGVLVSGGLAALVVPLSMRGGWETRPWLIWVLLVACLLASIVAGERLWKRRQQRHAA